MDYIWFWLAKPIAEFLVGVAVIVAVVAALWVVALFITMKQKRCAHKDYYETQACDAICRDCGKNLGFIGTVRGDK